MRIVLVVIAVLAIAGCYRAPYEPSSDARIMRQFYLECLRHSDPNTCIKAVRDEFFWAYGEDLEFVVTGEVAQ